MTALVDGSRPAQGLRERKKAKTRAAIQRHALRLFQKQGYEATTVEQIADAAEVSPSTFFRYFPTKEEVVLYDALDPVLIAEFEAQPAELSPLQAMRRAIHAVFGHVSPEDLAEQRERGMLILTVPELRMRTLDEALRSSQLFADMVARRVGRSPDDLAVLTFVGAVFGAMMAAVLIGARDPHADYLALMDASLSQLEAGLPL
ncbi:MAG TPA: TetR family transcriptional regulator [Ktedonobacterales bacterium]|jgi:AcrR family transcriptional regulator|nr:TetR family transcriptional regulator [Ktedonobacterales bacterium]